jgi:hypothetical protein
MVIKQPIYPDRIRKTPRQFSWLDHRLVSDHYIDRCTHGAAALYLFLVTVSDAKGMSYYSDRTLSQRMAMDEQILARSRNELVKIGHCTVEDESYIRLVVVNPDISEQNIDDFLEDVRQTANSMFWTMSQPSLATA